MKKTIVNLLISMLFIGTYLDCLSTNKNNLSLASRGRRTNTMASTTSSTKNEKKPVRQKTLTLNKAKIIKKSNPQQLPKKELRGRRIKLQATNPIHTKLTNMPGSQEKYKGLRPKPNCFGCKLSKSKKRSSEKFKCCSGRLK
jgi:hypothetical protein